MVSLLVVDVSYPLIWYSQLSVFDIPYDINDPSEGVRTPLASTVTWDDLQSQVAKIFNVHPDNLHLQYKFSNEPKRALPFNPKP